MLRQDRFRVLRAQAPKESRSSLYRFSCAGYLSVPFAFGREHSRHLQFLFFEMKQSEHREGGIRNGGVETGRERRATRVV